MKKLFLSDDCFVFREKYTAEKEKIKSGVFFRRVFLSWLGDAERKNTAHASSRGWGDWEYDEDYEHCPAAQQRKTGSIVNKVLQK